MKITKEILTAKLQVSESKRDDLTARLNAEIGVIAALKNLLGVLDQPEPPPEPPKSESPAVETFEPAK